MSDSNTMLRRKTAVSSVLIVAVALLLFAASRSQRSDPRSTDKVRESELRTIYVDDDWLGTDNLALGSRYGSIGSALTYADRVRGSGADVRVLIKPGVYRESLSIDGDQSDTAGSLFLQAQAPGTVIVSGSNTWRKWEETSSPGVYVASWPHNWGLGPVPDEWADSVTIPPIVRRREIVFVDNNSLRQVGSVDELTPGTFAVSEVEDKLYVALAERNIEVADVEVAERSSLLTIHNQGDVEIDGLKFIRASTPFNTSAVRVTHSRNIVLKNNEISYNGWGGLSICCSTDVVARNNKANYNGGIGMSVYRGSRISFDNNETSYNNWRGARGSYDDWSVAGSKYMLLRDSTFLRHRAVGNLARGVWFDTDVSDVVLDRATLKDNQKDGLFIEAIQGPIVVQNSVVTGNRSGGVVSSASAQVTIQSSLVCNNLNGQLVLAGESQRQFRDFVDHRPVKLGPLASWTVIDNRFISTQEGTPLLSAAPWLMSGRAWYQLMSTQMTFEGNAFTHPVPEHAVLISTVYSNSARWNALISGNDTVMPIDSTTRRPDQCNRAGH